jgi:uncharacterized repeat protein (TIGR01451 family)
MKKLLYLSFLLALATTGIAQTATLSLTTAPCNNDGVLTLNVTGLTPPLTVNYTTSGLAGTTITHTVSGLTDALTSYSGGTVYVYVTDGVAGTGTYYGGMPPFSYSIATTAAVCPALGTATATVYGGTAPFTYQWFDPATSTTVSTSNPASLAAGNYGVTITDAAGCVFGSLVYDDSANIFDASPVTLTMASTVASCTNGTATVASVSGATLPVSYLWSTGASSAGITGLSMGSYAVTVTDALGCSRTGYTYVSQSISIGVPVTPTPATCLASDGGVIAFGSGGMPPYTYLWSNGATTQSQTGIPAGHYGVTAVDANGCIGTGSGTVGASTPITVTSSSTSSLCTSPTGTATIAPSGGTLPYSILWYTVPPQTTTTATSLPPGNHSFKVTDALGCIRTGSVYVPPVNIISASFSMTPATCTLSNGSAHAYPSGGATPYTYSWSTGATTSTISSVPTGYYGVTITDAMGCSIHKSPLVPVYSPMTVGVVSTPASCIFTSDGTLSATASGGTTPYTYSWSPGGAGSSISGLGTGHYYLSVHDAMGCAAHLYNTVGYNPSTSSCYCTITGTIYADANGNCIQDAGEAGINNVQVYCSGRGYTYTDASGNYSFKVPTGTYTITETVLAFYPLSPCQTNNIVVSVTAATGCVTTVNFANTITPIHDMRISTWSYNQAVPGNAYHQTALVTNAGTVSEGTILSGYTTDGQIFAPSLIPSTIYSGSPYWYTTPTSSSFPTLSPGSTQQIYMNYSVPTTIPIGTNLVFKDSVVSAAPMSTWTSDYAPWNNVNYYNTSTVSSYDPNFKEVNPKGSGPTGIITAADTTLEYMVHFQNTGTYKATTVVVIDTLDNNLDWTSMRPVFQSHKCQVNLQQTGSYKIATFTFNNIDLPAQIDDDLRSNGMFTYTVKLAHGLAAGTQVRNSASIYFDYNEPVLTNTTLNTLESPTPPLNTVTTVSPESGSSFTVFPNPAQQTFNTIINSEENGMADMKVCDITGKVLLNKTISVVKGTQTIATNVNQLAPGMYSVSLSQNGKVQTQKLAIIK